MEKESNRASAAALREELLAICAAVEVHSPASFSFAGVPFAGVPFAGDGDAGAQRLVGLLYESCYASPFGRRRDAPEASLAADPQFARRLYDANAGRERWDGGWQVISIGAGGSIGAEKGGSRRTFVAGRYSAAGPAALGGTVAVWLAKGSFSLQPGFYHVFGDTLGESRHPLELVRLYFNVRAAGAPRLVEALTRRLNAVQVPFSFKTLSTPSHYAARSDGSVLYLGRPYFEVVARLWAELEPDLGADLEPATPLFTKRLAPGVGLAEDPAGGESFGQNRCRLLAEGLCAAGTAGERLAAVEQLFAARGLSLDRPYLNPRGAGFALADRYCLPAEEPCR